MNKKGGHVDWVISMGIFITYIFALFILLRPGIKPIYRPETLLDNLQDRFEDDIMWTVKTVPLFIRNCYGYNADTKEFTSVWVDDEENNWGTCSDCIKDADDNLVSDEFLSGTDLICAKPEFSSTHTSPFYYYFHGEGEFKFEYDFSCMSDTPADDCRADLGITENIEGINPRELSKIALEDYKILKDIWDFPESKEFAIFESDEKIIGAEPYAEANVFVRGIKTQEVTERGEKTPVTIYFKIW